MVNLSFNDQGISFEIIYRKIQNILNSFDLNRIRWMQ